MVLTSAERNMVEGIDVSVIGKGSDPPRRCDRLRNRRSRAYAEVDAQGYSAPGVVPLSRIANSWSGFSGAARRAAEFAGGEAGVPLEEEAEGGDRIEAEGVADIRDRHVR